MKFDGIILDIDGTIWNTTPVVAEAWNEAIEELFPQVKRVSAKILQGQFGKTMKVISDNLFPELTEDEKKLLMDKCCVTEHQALLRNTKNLTYPNVVESIKKLSEFYKIFIVSNCQKGYIEVVIEKNHLENFIVDSECYGNNLKNKDENIKLLVQRNHLENPVYVGDTQGDYDACKAAGVPFIFASYGFGSISDDNYFAEIKDFSDLLQILK